MALPQRTTLDDVIALCTYFSSKPTGATVKDAKAVLGAPRLDARKIAALKFWGLLEEQDQRLKVTAEGRAIAKNAGAARASIFVNLIKRVDPYRAVIERAAYQGEYSLTVTDVAAHWHDHFRTVAGGNDETLSDQALAFFHLIQGAELGTLTLGRKGSPTRVDFDEGALAGFISEEGLSVETSSETQPDSSIEQRPTTSSTESAKRPTEVSERKDESESLGQGIFIAHGKNKKPLEQLKRILDQFKIQYKVAVDEPNLGRPISSKVREIMQSCNCAILIFTADEEFKDKAGNTIWRPSENVVYELGATSYLYGNKVVIMKEDTVDFPSNFKDVGYISFANDQLEAKAMEILRELIGFGIVKVST